MTFRCNRPSITKTSLKFVSSTVPECYLLLTTLYLCADSTKLQSTVGGIKILHWTRSGEVSCYPKQSRFQGNLLTVKELQSSKLDGRVRSKFEVYSELINLLSLPGQWVFDPLGGSGICVWHDKE